MPDTSSALVGPHGINNDLLGSCGVVPAFRLYRPARLKSLVVLEEVTDLVAQQLGQVVDFFNVVVSGGQLFVGNRNQLGVATGFVFHVQYTNRTAANNGTGLDRVRGYYQHVQRVAVVSQGVRDEAVVGRVEHGGSHETVNQQGAHVFVQFVLDRGAVSRDFDGYVDVFRRVLASGDVVELHVRSFLLR